MSDEETVQEKPNTGPSDSQRDGLSWGATVGAIFLGGMALVAAYLLLIKLQRVLWVFAGGFLLSYFLEPVIGRLEKRGWSRILASWMVYLVLLAVLGLAIWAFIPALVNQALAVAENFPDYTSQVIEGYQQFRDGLREWMGRYVADTRVWDIVDERLPVVEDWSTSNVPRMLRWVSLQLLSSLRGVGIGLILLIISLQFSLLSGPARATIRNLIPPGHTKDVDEVGRDISAMLGHYTRGVIVLFFANGIGATLLIYGLGLFFGNEYALVVGFLTGITNMVPYIGPVVSAGSAALLTYVTATTNPLLATILAAAFMLVMSQYFGIIVQPKIIGRRINLHPLVILFAMFAGYEVFGLLGVIIGMPVAGCIKIILARWIPVIGPGPEVHAPSEPLLLDIGSAMQRMRAFFVRLGNSRTDKTSKAVTDAGAGTATGQAPAQTNDEAKTNNDEDE
ncbi:MAG: AI-2E family transporter [Armatimonadota bacterium]